MINAGDIVWTYPNTPSMVGAPYSTNPHGKKTNQMSAVEVMRSLVGRNLFILRTDPCPTLSKLSICHIYPNLFRNYKYIMYLSIYTSTLVHICSRFSTICLPCLHLDIQYMQKNAGCMLRLLLLPGSCCAPSISRTRPCFLFKTCRPRFPM